MAAALAKVIRGGRTGASSQQLLPAVSRLILQKGALPHLGSSPAASAAGMARLLHTRLFSSGKNVPYSGDLSKGHLDVIKVFTSWCPRAGEENLHLTRALITAAESSNNDRRDFKKLLYLVGVIFLLIVVPMPRFLKLLSEDQNSSNAELEKYRSELKTVVEELKRKRTRASLLKKRAEALLPKGSSTED